MTSRATPTVYLVDDDEAVRDSLRVLLESYDFTVRDFSSAAALIAAMPLPSPGILIVDLHMPGMDGLGLLGVLRERSVALPAIVITGRSDQSLREKVRSAGAMTLLDKPVDSDHLLETIASAFNPA